MGSEPLRGTDRSQRAEVGKSSVATMWRSKAALIITALYLVCITVAIVANQRGPDPEAVIVGQIPLGLSWVLPLVMLRINAGYGPYIT